VSYTYNISKEDNRKAVVGTIIVHILLILLLIFYKITTLDPPFPTTEFVMELDFSGSEASGGAPSQPSQSTSQTASNAEDLATQDDESPVTVTKGKTTTTKTTTKTTTEETKTTTQDPKYTFGNVFGNGGSGSGEGDKDGDGKGSGDGLSGPGGTGKSGTGDGSGRDILYKPSPDNPIQETGVVIVRVWIDRNGKVVSAVAQTAHPETRVTNPIHLSEAVKIAYKFKFSENASGFERETKDIKINFTLN
jgi:periplasmic protein TonB